jgi:hypothetical protein
MKAVIWPIDELVVALDFKGRKLSRNVSLTRYALNNGYFPELQRSPLAYGKEACELRSASGRRAKRGSSTSIP